MRPSERRDIPRVTRNFEPVKSRERARARNGKKEKKSKGGWSALQLKFPNGLEQNAPRGYCDFFIAPRKFIFGA